MPCHGVGVIAGVGKLVHVAVAVVLKLRLLRESIGDFHGKIKVVVNGLRDAGEWVGDFDLVEPGVVFESGLCGERIGDLLRDAPICDVGIVPLRAGGGLELGALWEPFADQ